MLSCSNSPAANRFIMKRIFSSGDSAEVGLRRSVLEAAHVDCEFRKRDSFSELFSPSLGTEELWVQDSDYEEAIALLGGSELIPSVS